MRLLLFGLVLLILQQQNLVETTVTANFISDPRSMFPKVMRTRNVFHFLQFYMGTFKQMFRNKTEIVNHFIYYDDQLKASGCYLSEEMDYAMLKSYFERYSATHKNPSIDIIFAFITKDGRNLIVEFHVSTTSCLGPQDHFHMVISAHNDESLGWGVRYIDMAFGC